MPLQTLEMLRPRICRRRLYIARVALAGLVAGVIALPGCAHGPGPSPGPNPEFTVIDIHTHLFNAHDLPLKGIFIARGVPKTVAGALAKALNAWTPDDDLEGQLRSGFTMSAPDGAASLQAKASSNSLDEILTPEEREELARYAGLPPPQDVGAPSDETDLDIKMVARAAMKADFPPAESPSDVESVGIGSANIGGYLDFVDIMTTRSRRIPQRLLTEEYQHVDLFVHHMMDLQRTYSDKPRLSFEEQIPRMGKLDGGFEGKLLHFVAYDPLRGESSLSSVQRGIDAGAVGVKFYPPSGYRALGNDDPEIDRLNRRLFAFCVARDIPIFTHCTPGGFEAVQGYGEKMADPKYWERALALDEFPTLRLCFGHSGGQVFWFGGGGSAVETRFSEKVVELCRTRPNVYCEVGYMQKILVGAGPADFGGRLNKEIALQSGHKYALGDKIMYGTDWHMLHKEQDHRAYLQQFIRAFESPALQPWKRKFFAENAMRYLRLSDLANDTRFTAKQRQYWHSLVAKSAVTPTGQ